MERSNSLGSGAGMNSLLDIAPPEITSKEIEIRGKKFPIQGISAKEWAVLYARFPELKRAVSGETVPAETSVIRALGMWGAVIAAGCGKAGDAAIEQAAVINLTDEEQRDLFGEIVAISHKGAVFGPLLEKEGSDNGG